ncbi:hypothetical protein L9F63_012786, partial [Diploptera punctata]
IEPGFEYSGVSIIIFISIDLSECMELNFFHMFVKYRTILIQETTNQKLPKLVSKYIQKILRIQNNYVSIMNIWSQKSTCNVRNRFVNGAG